MINDEILKKLRILYVEDEAALSRLLKEAIGSRFDEFHLAHDGMEGLAKYRKIKPDIVITDITMPKMDGLEMARKIHNEDRNIPLIVLSAYSDKEKLLCAIDVGINKYLIKPFDPDTLLEYICELYDDNKDRHTIKLVNGFSFDKKQKQLSRNNKTVRLTRRELGLIDKMIENSGFFMDTEEIKKTLWKGESVTDDALRVFIKRLREKTDRNFIQNSSGEGYYLETPE